MVPSETRVVSLLSVFFFLDRFPWDFSGNGFERNVARVLKGPTPSALHSVSLSTDYRVTLDAADDDDDS